MATSIQIVWHTHYNTNKKFYQAFLCGQKEKLDLLKVEFRLFFLFKCFA